MREQVALVGDDAGLQQRDRRLVAEALDVERAAAGDVEHPLPQLRRARPGVRAADVGVALLGRAPAWCRTRDTLWA